MTATLLLNASYEPMKLISSERAICLVLDQRAEVLEEDPEDPLRSPSVSFPRPLVIRMVAYVQVPFRATVPLSRRALMQRDEGRCAYRDQPRGRRQPRCQGSATTIDHVFPRARGGKHVWENVVAACRNCNGLKDDSTLADLGWELPFKPYAPKGRRWLLLGIKAANPAWEPYLQVA